MQNVTELFNDAICGECLNIIEYADPHNMGWTQQQYDEWVEKFDRYCGADYFLIVPEDYNDPKNGPYFQHSGCPICANGLGNDVYPVTVYTWHRSEIKTQTTNHKPQQ